MTCIFGPVARNIQGYVVLVVLWLVKLTSDVKQIRTKTTIIGTSKKDDFTRQFPHQGNNLLFDCSIHIYIHVIVSLLTKAWTIENIWGVNFQTLCVNLGLNRKLMNLKIANLQLSFERFRDTL